MPARAHCVNLWPAFNNKDSKLFTYVLTPYVSIEIKPARLHVLIAQLLQSKRRGRHAALLLGYMCNISIGHIGCGCGCRQVPISQECQYRREPGSRFRDPGLRLRCPGLSFREPGLSCRPPGLSFRRPGLSFRGHRPSFRDPGWSFTDPGLRFREPGIRYRDVGLRVRDPGLSFRDPRFALTAFMPSCLHLHLRVSLDVYMLTRFHAYVIT